MAEGAAGEFEEPYFAKFGNYQQFVNRFYAGTDVLFDEEHLFHVYPFPEEQVLIVGLQLLRPRVGAGRGPLWLDRRRAGSRRGPAVRRTGPGSDVAADRGPAPQLRRRQQPGQREPARSGRDFSLAAKRAASNCSCTGTGISARRGNRDPSPARRSRSWAPAARDWTATRCRIIPTSTRSSRSRTATTSRWSCGSTRRQTFGLTGQGRWTADASVHESGVVTFSLDAARPQPDPHAEGCETIAGRRPQAVAGLPGPRASLPAAERLRGGLPRAAGVGADLHLARAVPRRAHGAGQAGRESFSLDGPTSSAERMPENDSRPRSPLDEMEIGPALEFCERQGYSGMVVLGDPGSGKTTLLKFLTLVPGPTQTGASDGRALAAVSACSCRCGAWRIFGTRWTTPCAAFYADAMVRLELPGDFFQRVLADRRHPCLLMLDGLDEVATTERRQEALDWIEWQRKQFPHVTDRRHLAVCRLSRPGAAAGELSGTAHPRFPRRGRADVRHGAGISKWKRASAATSRSGRTTRGGRATT